MTSYKYIKVNAINESTKNKIYDFINKYPDDNILIEIPNTRDMTLENLDLLPKSDKIFIKVTGGYDKQRFIDYQDAPYVAIHAFSNIYSIEDMKQIIKELEKIENGMLDSWTDEQKLIYLINTIQDTIIYHPDFAWVSTKETRSLKGLISKKTACAGFSLILKELCDRNGIECYYTEGSCNVRDDRDSILTHAWNIVKIGNNYFPVDLTWNAKSYHYGDMKAMDSLCNISEFIQTHFPGKYEIIQNYQDTLSGMDLNYIRETLKSVRSNRTLQATRFKFERENKSVFYLTQVSNAVVDGEKVYKYIYVDESGIPLVLFSSFNMAKLYADLESKTKIEEMINELKEDKNSSEEIKKLKRKLSKLTYTDDKLKFYATDVLFSRVNIELAIKSGNFYLGNICDYKTQLKTIVDDQIAFKLNPKIHIYKRNDNSKFILEYINKTNFGDTPIYFYQMFEYVVENGEICLRVNNIYTEFDLFKDNRKEIANNFLSRSRIDENTQKKGGYLGNYSSDGRIIENDNLLEIFDRSKRKKIKKQEILKKTLTFKDLHNLLQVFSFRENPLDNIVVYNKTTGRKISNDSIVLKAIFAYIWFNSLKTLKNDITIEESFNEFTNKLYISFSEVVKNSIQTYGTINTFEVYEQMISKYDDRIKDMIIYLFQNDYFSSIIYEVYYNQIFSDKSEYKLPIPLYSKEKVNQKLNQLNNSRVIK